MIYTVTSRALEDAGLTIDQIDGVCMAASDLNDGRAISTMTLTGATGSLGKTEARVCNDSLAAVLLGWAEVASGAAQAVTVCSWSKFSDTRPAAIAPLAMEPAYHRGLAFHPDAILGLRRSRESGAATLTESSRVEPYDVAVATVLVSENHATNPSAHVVGVGSSMSSYLKPAEPLLEPLRAAADRALRHASTTLETMDRVVVAGVHDVTDDALAHALGVPEDKIGRQTARWADLGYAAGLQVLTETLNTGAGKTLVLSAAGLGYANTHAVVLEIS